MTFEVGDKVRCHRWEGEREVICGAKNALYPVLVELGNTTLTFTTAGKEHVTDSEPCLRHAATGKPVIVGEEPKRKWTPTQPTWCWVGNNEYQSEVRRLILDYTCDDGYLELTRSGHGPADNCWLYARPCEPCDIPAYWPKELVWMSKRRA